VRQSDSGPAEVSEPRVGPFDDPQSFVAPQRSSVLRGRPNAILLVRADQLDFATPQASPQWVAVIGLVGDHSHGFLPRTARLMASAYADRPQNRLDEFHLRQGCRTNVVSQRNTLIVDHHPACGRQASVSSPHPARFFRLRSPFFRESKTAVQKRLAPAQLLALVQLAQKRALDIQPNTLLLPVAQPPPAGRRTRIFLRYVLPAGAVPQNVQFFVQIGTWASSGNFPQISR